MPLVKTGRENKSKKVTFIAYPSQTLKSILLVDDDEDDREFFLSILNEINPSYSCTTVENGLVALECLATRRCQPDLIFLDLNMPVMDGRQFLKEIKTKESFSDIPVIILSTSSDARIIEETRQLGATEFITKPNKLSLLYAYIKQILDNPAYNKD
jgi:CheY-like chemotaxis protein